MKKYNKYGAGYRSVTRFEVENILHEDKHAAAFHIYSDKDEFYLYFLPNYENTTVEVSTNTDTKFSDAVLEFLLNNGDVQNIMEAVYNKAFEPENRPETATQIPLNLPSLNLPTFVN